MFSRKENIKYPNVANRNYSKMSIFYNKTRNPWSLGVLCTIVSKTSRMYILIFKNTLKCIIYIERDPHYIISLYNERFIKIPSMCHKNKIEIKNKVFRLMCSRRKLEMWQKCLCILILRTQKIWEMTTLTQRTSKL